MLTGKGEDANILLRRDGYGNEGADQKQPGIQMAASAG
jgi:hypothetical protein